MRTVKTRTRQTLPLLSLLVIVTLVLQSPPFAAAQQGRGRGGFPFGPGVYKSSVTPHWLTGNTRFWYRNDLPHESKEFILVDATIGNREPAFDHKRLAEALSKAADKEYKPEHLPFDSIEFVNDGAAIQFTVDDVKWTCNLANYETTRQQTKESSKSDASTSSDKTSTLSPSSSSSLDRDVALSESPADSVPANIDRDPTDESADPEASIDQSDDQLASPQAQSQDSGAARTSRAAGGSPEGRERLEASAEPAPLRLTRNGPPQFAIRISCFTLKLVTKSI